MFLKPDDPPGVAYEFFAPFAHIPGRVEACRIRSPTHGVFDCLIVLHGSTSSPVTVYVNSSLGQSFMAERYGESRCIRVAPNALAIGEGADGRTVTARLEATEGPLRKADLTLRGPAGAIPRQVPYGGDGSPVWGSRWTCWGVDLVLDAAADGSLAWEGGRVENLRAAPAIVTMGSFGRLAPRV